MVDIKRFDFINGEVLLFDKPLYWTSFDLVKKLRGAILKKLSIKKIKVGHAGTLDPLATGLMIICTGKATKTIDHYQDLAKVYEAEIVLGATTPSFDLETEIDHKYNVPDIQYDELNHLINHFMGTYEQEPPIYSAKLIDGKRAYEYARKGTDIQMKKNTITIYNIDIINFKSPVLKIRVKCSKGTYIRSLARDIGRKLNTGAYLGALKRTEIGDFNIDNSLSINDFENYLKIM
ncbi:MAG: tRNA pseudouridine(55) synthase TruB [Bacteroidales bacterium]|nr:tRNA pseudouridine(55) synthase TruB [Bacteroidales bacterium]